MKIFSDRLFLFFVFLLPFQTVYLLREPMIGGEKWQYGTIGIYLSALVLALAVLVAAIAKAASFGRASLRLMMKIMWTDRKSEVFLIAFVMWAAFSILWARDHTLALYGFLILLLAADAFVMTRDMVRRGMGDRIIIILIVSAVLQAIIGIWQFLEQETFSSTLLGTSAHPVWQAGTSVLKNDAGRWLRAYGTFPHPNVYGLLLSVVSLIAIEKIISSVPTPHPAKPGSSPRKGERDVACAQDDDVSMIIGETVLPPLTEGRIEEGCRLETFGLYKRAVFISSIPILLLGLILSFSRLAWAGFALGFAYLVWLRFLRIKTFKETKWRYPLAVFATIIISTAIFSCLLHETVFPRFDDTTIGQERSVVDRMTTYRDAFKVIREHPFLGSGMWNSTAELVRLDPGRPVWDIQPAHDVPLLVLTELGIPGLLLGTFYIFQILFVSVKRKNIAGIAMLLMFLPSLLLDHFLWDSTTGMFILGSVSGMLAYGRR